MSSNPYVVRTDARLGFLQRNDLIPQNIAVGKLKIDCYCSGLLQQLQNEYLNLFSTIPNSPKIGQLLRDIQEIQRLQTEFQANEYTSMKDIKLAHKNLNIALNNIKSIPKKEGITSYFQELKKNSQPPNKGLPPTPFNETDDQRESRLFFEKQRTEVEDTENKFDEAALAIEKKNKQDLLQLENQRVERERNAELFRIQVENQKNVNDREITLRQKREQQAAQQLEHEKKIGELRKKEAESQNQLNELQKRLHPYNVHPALPPNQALSPLIPEGPKPSEYEDILSKLTRMLAVNEAQTAELENQRQSGNPQVSDYIVQMTMPEPPPLQMPRPEPPAPVVPTQRPEPPAAGQANTIVVPVLLGPFGGSSAMGPPPAPPHGMPTPPPPPALPASSVMPAPPPPQPAASQAHQAKPLGPDMNKLFAGIQAGPGQLKRAVDRVVQEKNPKPAQTGGLNVDMTQLRKLADAQIKKAEQNVKAELEKTTAEDRNRAAAGDALLAKSGVILTDEQKADSIRMKAEIDRRRAGVDGGNDDSGNFSDSDGD